MDITLTVTSMSGIALVGFGLIILIRTAITDKHGWWKLIVIVTAFAVLFAFVHPELAQFLPPTSR